MKDKQVCLRALEPSDADLLYVWENDTETFATGLAAQWPLSLSDIRLFIEESTADIWQTRQKRFMIDNSDGVTIGCIDIFDFDPLNGNCSFGLLIDRAHRRCGYGMCALLKLEKYVCDILSVKNIKITIAADNHASLCLFEKLGYEHVGTLRRWLHRISGRVDMLVYQKTFVV
mgnify:CR=1 FL=1